MGHATPPPAARTDRRVSGYCTLEYGHVHCQPGPVTTSYGEIALVYRCDCSCHKTEAGR